MNLASQTNVIYSGELPKDFYSYAAEVVQNDINMSDNENINKLNINREFIKKSVMTIPYNITPYGITDHIKDKCIKHKDGNKVFYLLPLVFTKDNIPVRLYNKDITSLAHLIYNAILNNIPSPKLLNKYLEERVDGPTP